MAYELGQQAISWALKQLLDCLVAVNDEFSFHEFVNIVCLFRDYPTLILIAYSHLLLMLFSFDS